MREWLNNLAFVFLGFALTALLYGHLLIGGIAGFVVCVVALTVLGWRKRHSLAEEIARLEHKKWIYGVLVLVGNSALVNLEGAIQQSSFPGKSETHMNQIVQFVMNYERACQEWMQNATIEVEDVAGKTGRTLFNSSIVQRHEPNFVVNTNSVESQIWHQTAARVDWLRDELAKL
jgi:hypothetical protein